MRLPTHVTVTAPEGRLTPIHPEDGVGIAGAALRIGPGEVCRVRWSQTTIRAVRRGDLILCTAEGTPVGTPQEAERTTDLPGLRVILAPSTMNAGRAAMPNMQADPDRREAP